MAILNGSVLEVVLSILGGPPDTRINPRIWQELVKLQEAVKTLAAAADAQLNSYVEVPFEVVGTLNSALYLGSLTTVSIVAGESISAGSPVVFVNIGSNTLRAYNKVNGPADGCTLNNVGAGASGDFILKGLVAYPRQTASPTSYITPYHHNRLATVLAISAYGGADRSGYYTGQLSWMGSATAEYYYRYIHGQWFIGTRLGYIGPYTAPYADWTTDFAYNALVYFNPRRA